MLASAVGAGLLVGLGLRGDLRRLASIRIRWWPLFVGAIVLRSLAALPLGSSAQHLLYVVSLWSLFLVVAANARLPGVPLAALGIALNAIAVSLSGGVMPVSPDAVATAGVLPPADALHVLTPDTPVIADVIPIPILGVYSVGDVLLALGVFILIVTTMRSSS